MDNNEIYKELMSKLSEKDKKDLRAQQRQWIEDRDKNARNATRVLDTQMREWQYELLHIKTRYEFTKQRVDELVALNKQIDADD